MYKNLHLDAFRVLVGCNLDLFLQMSRILFSLKRESRGFTFPSCPEDRSSNPIPIHRLSLLVSDFYFCCLSFHCHCYRPISHSVCHEFLMESKVHTIIERRRHLVNVFCTAMLPVCVIHRYHRPSCFSSREALRGKVSEKERLRLLLELLGS